MASQRTVYMIRPFGMPFRLTIRRRMQSAGLSIVASRRLKIPRWAFEKIYPRDKYASAPQEVWWRRMILTTGGISEMGILEGEDAVARLVQIVGERPDPADCTHGTIRRDFGASSVENFDGFAFHLRTMHRPENEEEAAHDLPIFLRLLKEGAGIRVLST